MSDRAREVEVDESEDAKVKALRKELADERKRKGSGVPLGEFMFARPNEDGVMADGDGDPL